MTKKIVLSAIAASVMATSAMATYGSTMLGYTAKDRAMGGTGIASTNGASSVTLNPAMIAGAKEEVSVNLHYMMIDVTAANGGNQGTFTGAASGESATDTSIIPTALYVKPLSKNLTIGAGFYGAAGMGVDYKGNDGLFNMYTNLAIAKLVVPVAYKTGAFSVGITPVIAQGSLEIAYDASAAFGGGNPFTKDATDTAFGYEIGFGYEISKELTVGLLYKAPISMTYENVISSTSGAAAGFQLAGITDELEQAAETGLGVSYKMGASTINVDYKTIAWSSAAGYKDFGWLDQDIISLGYEYAAENWTARVGYSTSDTPLDDTATPQIDVFNALGFPATPSTHMTFGGSYNVSKQTTIEGAVVLVSADSQTMTGVSLSGAADGTGTATATNDQTNVTIGVNYKF